jgi:peptidyl-prolyl cis-trans isomerase SurA
MVYRIVFFCLLAAPVFRAKAQPKVIDEIVAVVGDNYILRSDIEKEYETLREQMGAEYISDTIKIDILDQLISKKILLHKAQLDSIDISDERLEGEMEQKLQMILSHFGGNEKALEDYLGTTVVEFKAKTKPKMKEQLLVQEMQNSIIGEVKISPSEVRKYFNSIPKDSLPPVPAEVEIAQIVRKPKVSAEAKEYARMQAEDIRARLIAGEDFCRLARVYSDDPGSSGKCGELGFFKRGKMVPEFEATAFRLPKDSISKIIESKYGFHIIQVVERRGESVSARHILIAPQIIQQDLMDARNFLDSLRTQISLKNISFEEAAKKHSEDENTASSGGKLSDYNTGNTRIPVGQLDKAMYFSIKDLKPGEMTYPKAVQGPDGKELYVVYLLVLETEPHLPTLETDYLRIQAAALESKKSETLAAWMEKSTGLYYIKINERYANEPELAKWIK